MDYFLETSSKAYLEGRLSYDDYKATIYSISIRSRNPEIKLLVKALIYFTMEELHILARDILKAGDDA